MKCKKCGNEYEGKFCPSCGTPADDSADKKLPKKNKKNGIILIVAVLVVLGIIGAGMSPDEQPDSSAVSSATETATPAPEATPEPTPITYEATNESMQLLFENTYSKEYEDLSVSIAADETGTNVCTVAYFPTGSYWDDTSFVQDCMSTYINFSRQAYTVDGIDLVYFSISSEMKDTRGNSSVYPVVEFAMPKDTFSLYNWDEVSGSVIGQFSNDCTTFTIAPGILQNVDTENVFYLK